MYCEWADEGFHFQAIVMLMPCCRAFSALVMHLGPSIWMLCIIWQVLRNIIFSGVKNRTRMVHKNHLSADVLLFNYISLQD